MIIKLPFKTPTVNHLYFHYNNRMILTKVARDKKKEIKEILDNTIWTIPVFSYGLSVEVEIHENWFTKKKQVAKKDVANREKFLIDAVFDAMGLDDKYIWDLKISKVQSDEEFAVIKVLERRGDL